MSDSVGSKSDDGSFDVACVILIIALVVSAALFWVSGQ